MSKIVNSMFTVGQRYVGDIDHSLYTVVDVSPAGTVITYPNGGMYTLRHDKVTFKHEPTGKIVRCSLTTAQHLLLTLRKE